MPKLVKTNQPAQHEVHAALFAKQGLKCKQISVTIIFNLNRLFFRSNYLLHGQM